MPRRRKDKIDENQTVIVTLLRSIPGVTVETGKDDILVGCMDNKGIPRTWWFEIKNPDKVSPVTGQIRPSALQKSQQATLKKWTGQYNVVSSLDEILAIIGL